MARTSRKKKTTKRKPAKKKTAKKKAAKKTTRKTPAKKSKPAAKRKAPARKKTQTKKAAARKPAAPATAPSELPAKVGRLVAELQGVLLKGQNLIAELVNMTGVAAAGVVNATQANGGGASLNDFDDPFRPKTAAECNAMKPPQQQSAADPFAASNDQAAGAVSKMDAAEALKEVSAKNGLEGCRSMLKKFGVQRLGELKEDQYADFVKACKEAIGGEAAAPAAAPASTSFL